MMRRNCGAALAAWLMAAGIAAAQIPRDPVASGASAAQPSSAALPSANATTGRQLPPPFVTKQADVEIPFSVRPGANAEAPPKAVRIFISWDGGKSWHFYEERRPEDARFRFRARQDGEFWFATQTVDRTGRTDSGEPRWPQLRLVIDTQRPQLLLQASVDSSGNVNLSWTAIDANLNPASLRIEYQDASGTGGPWQTVEWKPSPPSTGQISGQTIFRAAVSGLSINLRAEIADTAGNAAYHSQRLSLNPPKPKPADGLAYAPAVDPSATRWPTENPHVPAPAASQIASDKPATDNTPDTPEHKREEVRIPNLVSNPFVGPGRLASSRPAMEDLPPPAPASRPGGGEWRPSQQPTDSGSSNERLPLPSAPAPAEIGGPSAAPSIPAFDSPPMHTQERAFPSASSLPPPAAPAEEIRAAPQQAEPVDAPTAQRPRLTNSRRFSLDYDVQTVGPEGVAAVELWGTADGGRSWMKWGSDPDKTSPFDIEVNREAVYGFRIVVVGKNGLATTTPQAGDAADIWVGIDLTRPSAKLTGAAYGQGEASGKLDIRWQVDDANLGSRPIALAIGDRPDGPFTPIAAGLPNTGQYFWAYDPRSPRQIYLRLEARDDAGNIAIDQLTEPIKVEGLEPKGQIRGFKSSPEINRGASRSQPKR